MRVFRKFWRLPRQDRWLLLEALAFVVVSRLALWIRPERRAWHRLRVPMWTVAGADAERIAWAVSVTAARVPEASCLTQALAGREMLRRRGKESEIRLGVAMANGFEAHAWLVVEGRILLGGGVGDGKFVALGRLPGG